MLPAWRNIFYGLPRLIEETRWVKELPEALKQEGFQNIRLDYLTLSGSALLTATAPSHARGRRGGQVQGG
jgi:demethylmenaquinone methyltransferase/2-methoxy-6-polyprenyl-1,4-benzoquinol methylase